MDNISSLQTWWNGAVLYQIYPRSFQDSNGDGVGDLPGIISRLDYLEKLGVNCVWLSPFYRSPMKDYGYDVADYCDVDPMFGSLADFDTLVQGLHQRGIRIMVDFIPNHTSDQHSWFIESAGSRDNPKSDWYIWRDANPDGSPPSNWISVFGGSMWQWHPGRQQFYLHTFLREQPDLNWENPAVCAAMQQAMRFWFERGVDGLRVDAVPHLGKDMGFPNEAPNPAYDPTTQDEYASLLHQYDRGAGNYEHYIQTMLDVAAEYTDRLIVLEDNPVTHQDPKPYLWWYHQIDRSFCIPFNFELPQMPWQSDAWQRFIDSFQAGLRPQDVPVYVLGNHDQPRFVTRVGADGARVGALILLALPGIGVIYNGEELGMQEAIIPPEARHDPAPTSRDGCRTPMQWSASNKAGFTTGKPWLPLASDYQTVNVVDESADPQSMLNLYRALIGLRKTNPALHYGVYLPGPTYPGVISFTRSVGGTSVLILGNTTDQPVTINPMNASLLLSTAGRTTFDSILQPNEGVILSLKYEVSRVLP